MISDLAVERAGSKSVPVPLRNAEICRWNNDDGEQSTYCRLSNRARMVEANESNCDEKRYDAGTL